MTNKPKAFIFLHGYGNCGNDMRILENTFKTHSPAGSIFLYPDAPFRVPNNNGFSWFPFVLSVGESGVENLNEENLYQSMQQAMPYLYYYIDANVDMKKFSISDIFLIGFSQGAGLAVHSCMRFGKSICGAVSFSGGFVNPKNRIKSEEQKLSKTPICFIHGEKDKILPYQLSISGYNALKDIGFKSEILLIPNAKHTITKEGMNFAGQFVEKILNNL